MKAYVRAVGVHCPSYIMTNAELETMVDTTDEWIRSRSGISERRIVKDPNIMSSDLAVAAAQDAMAKAGVKPEEIDGIIVGSIVADETLPATACIVQKKLGAFNAFAYDVTAACGFVPIALNQAALMIQAGQCKNILLIGSEIMSRTLNWEDRNSCVLFGDGAGALLVSACEDEDRGVIDTYLKADGTLDHILHMPAAKDPEPYLHMDGRAVFKKAVIEMATAVEVVLQRNQLTVADIDVLVPHQANIRIMESAANRLGLPHEKVVHNLEKYGNTSSASVPLVLAESIDQGLIRPGQLVAIVAIGAGMNWGCTLVRW